MLGEYSDLKLETILLSSGYLAWFTLESDFSVLIQKILTYGEL